MKIYCNIDLDSRKFEGRTQLANRTMHFLKKQGFKFIKNPAEADLFHFHSSGVLDSYKAYKLKKKYHKPCFYSLYSNVQTEPLRHWINFLIQKIYFQKTATKFLQSYSAALPLRWRSIFLKKIDLIIVPSQHLKQSLFQNTKIIPFGVDTDKFKPLEKKGNTNKDTYNLKIKVAYFGHPGVFKGLNDFVNASKTFSKNIEPHVFFTQRFKKVDKYIIKNNSKIKIHGFVENIVNAYNEIDIIVLPYRTQIGTVANPLVLLEAMACGKPIITTNFKFIKEIVRDSAIITKRCSPKSIAKSINMLAKKPELQTELGKRARKIIVDNYSQEIMFKEYLNLYQKIKLGNQLN